jgi:hypothetical protein
MSPLWFWYWVVSFLIVVAILMLAAFIQEWRESRRDDH